MHQNISVVTCCWHTLLQKLDSDSDTLSGFQLSDKKNRLGISTIPNRVEHTKPIKISGDEL